MKFTNAMKRSIFLLVILLFSGFYILQGQVPSKSLKITNVGNEGFLLAFEKHKVLIDALYSDGYGYFSVPPKEVLDQMMFAVAPFDSVNMYLLTHYHKDHCEPSLINDYLTKNPKIPFVTTYPSIVFIDGCCFGFIVKKKQFKIITPELNQCIADTVNGIALKVFGLKHLSFYRDSIDIEQTMFNVSYLVDMDGIRVFHSGDIEMNGLQDYLLKNGKWTDAVDVAFLYYGLLKSGEKDLDYILEVLKPKHIVIMHLPPSMYAEWDEKVDVLKKKFPNIRFFKNSMESATLELTSN